MQHATQLIRRCKHVHVAVLQGAGAHFCAGGNPYASSGPTSLSVSSQQLIESVQVWLLDICLTCALITYSSYLYVLCRVLSPCVICAYLS